MPIYDVTFNVQAVGWATFEAEDDDEAAEIAHLYFNTSDMDCYEVEVDTIEAQAAETLE